MRHYYIYLMKQEVAADYFGKEWLIFRLFEEAESANAELKAVIERQINYITRTIPSLQIKRSLEKLNSCYNVQAIQKHYYLDIKALASKAMLNDYGNMLTITAKGSYQAETIFFEVLRQINPAFFALDLENCNYGWLNPVKHVNYI